jgi:hypothetical protein
MLDDKTIQSAVARLVAAATVPQPGDPDSTNTPRSAAPARATARPEADAAPGSVRRDDRGACGSSQSPAPMALADAMSATAGVSGAMFHHKGA